MGVHSLSTSEKLYYKKRISGSFSKTSTGSDNESDSDDDEYERRKYISLKGPQCLLWSASKFGTNNYDLSQDINLKDLDDCHHENAKNLKSFFKRNINGRYSLRQIRLQNKPLNLDNIQIDNEFDYGFNPQRPTGSQGNNIIKLRPISLYSPPRRQKSPLKSTLSDAGRYANKHETIYSPNHFLKRTVSHARNDFEVQLEKKVLLLRAQPCNLKFQGSKGKLNEQELAEDIANARRRRFVRRQLSFDSHPRRKWRKTISLDSGLATDSLRSLKNHTFLVKNEFTSKSEELLDIDSTSVNRCKTRSIKSVEFLDIKHSSPRDNTDSQSENTIIASLEIETLVPSSCDILVSESVTPIKVLSQAAEESVEPEILLGLTEKNKAQEKTSRKKSFPQILNVFRFPNKQTFRKFIRKKTPGPISISAENSETGKDETSPIQKLETSFEISGTSAFERSISVNSTNSLNEAEETMKNSTENLLDKSCSSYSLPRVDEDKESLEFGSPLERRTKSSCSISFEKTKQTRFNQEHIKSLQRRLSDTVLSSNDRALGCSPGRKFVRRLLSPVVCGMYNSPDRYGILNDSMQSLQSYDSASITSDSDITYPQLFDFGSQELAEEMTLIDKELLVRIPWEELSILGWMSNDKFSLAPNIMKMVQFFNRVAMLVSTSILSEETVFRRAKIIRKAIKLAARCRYAKNYNSLKAVLGGLQCTPIFRLKATWKQVPSRYRRMFRELSELMTENNNFSIYRQELTTALRNPPCIPFLGNFLTQLAHTHAFMAIQVKLKSNSFIINRNSTEDENDAKEADKTPTSQPKTGQNVFLNINNVQNDKVTHTRSDSDDSGVALNLNRLSHVSDDSETSPRENCTSSPDEENFEDVFNKQSNIESGNYRNKQGHYATNHLEQSGFHLTIHSPITVKKCKSFQNVNIKPTSTHKKCLSVDNGMMGHKQFNDITNIINNKPAERDQGDTDELYECELMFWKYQISSVQYNIIPRSYIRRYLMNSPYNSEEENYRLSLKREQATS